MACSLVPRDNWVIVEREITPEYTPGGLIRPQNQQVKMDSGIVLAIGPGKYEYGVFVKVVGIEVGDRVHFAASGATDVIVDNKDYCFLPSTNCISVSRK